jgi:hypothetical protein
MVSRQRISRLASAAMMVTTMIAGASPTRSINKPNAMIASRIETCGRIRLRSIGGPSSANARNDRKAPISTRAQLRTVGI